LIDKEVYKIDIE